MATFSDAGSRQDNLYAEASATYGAALNRLSNAYEPDVHCMQLERQRDLLRSVWLWYLLPCVPGLLVLQIGQALAHPERMSRIVAFSVLFVVFMAGTYEPNRRAAVGIQQRIDRLKENR